LRRAWTVNRLMGSLRFPGDYLAGHGARRKIVEPDNRNVRFRPQDQQAVADKRGSV
jgi:hypothetical protein